MRIVSIALLLALLVAVLPAQSVIADDSKVEVKDWLQNPTYTEPYTTKIETNKYEINISGEKVKVGKGTNTFVPEITLYRWDEECYVRLGEPLVNNAPLSQKNAGSTITADTIQWASKDIEFKFYPVDADSQNEFGSFEYDMTIANSKAGTNKILSSISFPLETAGLEFYYQAPLTQEEIDAGARRPENVEGSYAVYHSTKRDHIVGQVNYATGKAFHIYRPMLIDNAGNTAYADISIADGYLTVDYSNIQGWLNKAKYPVSQTAGLEFGYTSLGGTGLTVNATNYAAVQSRTSPADISGNTITSISIGGLTARTGGSSVNSVKGCIWSATGDPFVGYPLISNAVGDAVALVVDSSWPYTGFDWAVSEFATPPSLSDSTAYYIGGVFYDADFYCTTYIAYDAGSPTILTDYSNNYATPEALTYNMSPSTSKDFSCYVSYEAGGTPEITNEPDSIAWGIVAINTSSSSAIDYFTITNTGSGAVDVTIQCTDFTGGDDTWDLSDDASYGENIYGLKAGLDDDDDTFDIIVKEVEAVTLVSNLAESATQDWGLEIYMPSTVPDYDGQQMEATITLVVSPH